MAMTPTAAAPTKTPTWAPVPSFSHFWARVSGGTLLSSLCAVELPLTIRHTVSGA